jgi:predicted transcriptional regulator
MNKRQYEILIVLLEEEKHFSVEELAECHNEDFLP